MNDMRAVIVPKSDQINADDLLAGPITITVREVSIRAGTEQPVSISFDGDNGKPYKPCKSMARVMVHCWGPDANTYVGRSMTLYCDPKVKWGGMAVGGIRISHMSHIDNAVVMALTETKGSKKPFTVKPLAEATQAPDRAAGWVGTLVGKLTAVQTLDLLAALIDTDGARKNLANLRENRPELSMVAEAAIAEARARLAPSDDSFGAAELDPTVAADATEQNPDPTIAPATEPPPGTDAASGPDTAPDPEATRASDFVRMIDQAQTPAEVNDVCDMKAIKTVMARWKKEKPELFAQVDGAAAQKLALLRAAA